MTADTQSDAFGQRLMALFEAVLELDADAREARIAEVADTEPALADAVRALIARDAETGALRAHLAAEVEPLLREALPSLPSDPQAIGPYAVLRRLGEGGMGRVYLARRSDSPVAQNVAIKLIRSDRVSPGLLDRFEAERRHLAALDHPGICRFIDAASLVDGTPYVVMEAVEGVPIIDYCAQRELGVDARLKLLRKLLAAVAHAHDRLLVHRDIKPQNVLVTADGEPKLLDFGIAKSIEAEHASQTRTAERFFTPNASAPEQLLGGAFGVGCDVYALGALAYELLSDHLPFDFDGLRAAEIERLILQVAPPLMSERAPAAIARELRGDLDAIVATCLRKAPAERYANVSALDSDLARYLEGRPVEARAPSWIYRAKLFVRRHRVAVGLSATLVSAIAVFSTGLVLQAAELREQRNLALAERDRTLQVLETLESQRPSEGIALLRRVVELDPGFAAAHGKLAGLFFGADQFAAAEASLKAALQAPDRLSARERLSLDGLASFFGSYDSMQAAWRALSEAYPDHAAGPQNLGVVRWFFGNDFSGAAEAFEIASRIRNPRRSYSLQQYASMQVALGNNEAAEAALKDAFGEGNTSLFDIQVDPLLVQRRYTEALAASTFNERPEPPQIRTWKALRRAAIHLDQGQHKAALDVLSQLESSFGDSMPRPDAIRLALARAAVNGQSSNQQITSIVELLESETTRIAALEHADRPAEFLVLALALRAARWGHPAPALRAASVVRRRQAGLALPAMDALQAAIAWETGTPESRPPSLGNGLQELGSEYRSKRDSSPAEAESLARQLCTSRGAALTEWGFGYSLMLQNLMDSNQACLDAAELAEARGLTVEAIALREPVLRAQAGTAAD